MSAPSQVFTADTTSRGPDGWDIIASELRCEVDGIRCEEGLNAGPCQSQSGYCPTCAAYLALCDAVERVRADECEKRGD